MIALLQISIEFVSKVSERILKIGKYLVMIWIRVWCLFLTRGALLKTFATNKLLDKPVGDWFAR